MVSLSLPRPSVEYSWASVHPRPLRPVVPSTYSGPLPAPPCPPRPSPLESYALSTHIVAGVLPRSTADVPLPPSPPLHEDKVARQRRTAQTAGDLLSVREKHEQGEHTAPASTLQLWNCIDRYVRTDYEDASATTGLTLFFAHANGMHKEVRRCLAASRKGSHNLRAIQDIRTNHSASDFNGNQGIFLPDRRNMDVRCSAARRLCSPQRNQAWRFV